MSAENKTVRSITGRATTAGAAEETLDLVVDGAAGASSVAVATGEAVVISDIICGSNALGIFKIQQDDGSGFFDVAIIEAAPMATAPSPMMSYNVGVVINGGANVAFRARVETPGGASPVRLTLRSYLEP